MTVFHQGCSETQPLCYRAPPPVRFGLGYEDRGERTVTSSQVGNPAVRRNTKGIFAHEYPG
jgi:hypothetical protein